MRISTYITHPEVQSWHFGSRERDRLAAGFPGADIQVCETKAAFLEALTETEIALVWNFSLDWLDRAPQLKWVATPAAGREYLPPELADLVRVTYGTFHGIIMSETVLGMMLTAKRRLFTWKSREAPWPLADYEPGAGLLRGAHAVVLGYGPIGRAVSATLLGIGMRVTAIKRVPLPAGTPESPGLEIKTREELDGVLPEADHLVLVLPDTPETVHLVDRERLMRLPERAWVYNVGRGRVMDEVALADLIGRRRLAGAFLDVFEEEPLPEASPLRRLENVYLLPHASAISPEYLTLFVDEILAQARRFGFNTA